MSVFKIYHNPRCSKSRQTLALLEDKNVSLEIVEYLKTPPSKKELKQVLSFLSLKPQDLMRKKEAEYLESGLNNSNLTVDQQIDLMLLHPKVIERPIVVGNGKAAIGRPPENVLDIL